MPLESVPSGPPQTSKSATASLVLGILSFLFGILAGIPAVICGHIALSKIKRASGRLSGRGLAIAGLVLGYLGIALTALVLCIAIVNLARNVSTARDVGATADLQAIRTQLALYQSMNGFYPTTEQGLQALVVAPTSSPTPERWYQLFSELPKDPWKRSYIYLCPGRKNPDSYDLYSAGPDGKPDTPDDIWGR